MLPLRVLSQTAHMSYIETIVISLNHVMVTARGQRQGVRVLWWCEATRKQLHRDHLRNNLFPPPVHRVIFVR